jgi:hypothetical protein
MPSRPRRRRFRRRGPWSHVQSNKSKIRQVRRESSAGFVTRFSINAANGESAARKHNKFAYKRFASPEATLHAVRLAMTVGVAEACRRLGLKEQTLRTWIKLRRPQPAGRYSGQNLRKLVLLARELYAKGEPARRIGAMKRAARQLDMKWSSLLVHINMECVAVPSDWPIYQDSDAQARMVALWNGTGNGSPLADATPYPDSYFAANDLDVQVKIARPKTIETVVTTEPTPEVVAAFRRPDRTVAPGR